MHHAALTRVLAIVLVVFRVRKILDQAPVSTIGACTCFGLAHAPM